MTVMRTRRRISRLAGGAIVAAILLYLLLPTLIIVAVGFGPQETLSFPPQGFSLRWFARAFGYRDFQQGFNNSMIIMCVAAPIATVIGTGFVYVAERFPFRGVGALRVLLASPLVVPHFFIGLGGLILASQLAAIRTYGVVIVTHVILVLPFVMRSVLVSLRAIDPALARAAASLGASPARVFWTIDVPLVAPGLFGGFLFAAILSLTEFSASLFMTAQSTQTLPVAMFNYTRDSADPSLAAISTILIVIVAALLVVATRWLGLARILSVQHGR